METETSATMPTKPDELLVQGRAARVYVGGRGPVLLLLHGGFGGARMHWGTVWSDLTRRYRVVAPELPGLGALDQPALPTVAAYATWLGALLDALGVARAWVVGNSFGASVAWTFSSFAPARCDGIVLVNGYPMPATPAPLAALGRLSIARSLLRRLVTRLIYTRRSLALGFSDVTRVPRELEDAVARAWPRIVPPYVSLLIAGDGAPTPAGRVVLLWGEDDHLPGTSLEDGRKLAKRLHATLRTIAGAGHFPQIEKPHAFASAIDDVVGADGDRCDA